LISSALDKKHSELLTYEHIANINNPTPSLQEAIEQFNNGQFHWLKTTDEGECKFDSNDIPYVDQSYGKINHYFGYSSDPNDPGLAWAKQHGGNFYINVKDSILPSTLVRYVYAGYEHPDTPGIQTWEVVNTPDNLGHPGEPVDPKIPNDPKQPSGTDKASLEKVITKMIHYVDEQGKQLLADKTYQVTYTRTATYQVNNAGEVSAVEYSDWQTDNDDLGNNGEPSISDYYVKTAEPDAITDNHVQVNAANIETKIVYAQVQIKTAVDVPEAHGWAVDVPEPVYVKTAVDVPEPIYIKTKVDVPEPTKLTKTGTKISNKKIVKNAFEKPTLQSEIDQNNFKEQLPQTSATPKKSGSSIIAVCITLVCSLLLTLKKLNHKFFKKMKKNVTLLFSKTVTIK
ncbi:mucin-binding protein, partial [Leuconostoc falkenbergense]|uniref:mucin-binding protein n=1 Tax=Leuconostoc falkenbergense TaxID=2766470 RepID=UPI003F9CCD57